MDSLWQNSFQSVPLSPEERALGGTEGQWVLLGILKLCLFGGFCMEATIPFHAVSRLSKSAALLHPLVPKKPTLSSPKLSSYQIVPSILWIVILDSFHPPFSKDPLH